MKRLIFQSYHPAEATAWNRRLDCYRPIDDLAELSIARMKAYAESIGADYVLQDKPKWKDARKHPAWTRWAMFELAAEYDEMAYFDCDLLPTPHAFGVSIFDTDGHAKLTEREAGSREAWHMNAGVFKVNKREAFAMKGEIHKNKYVKELMKTGKNQEQFNEAFKKSMRRKPKHFGTNWNTTRPYHRQGIYYIHHYIGAQKTERGNQFGNLNTNGIYEWNLSQA